ncbi:MAG: tRNA epoxyqueuosine(34) reductase QueG [Deltaproteobacteria bacterium]|nr:tRNA epoxyqueuosine(34) reductase QueG [Deltaproteobacteria bacterium]
MCPPLKEKEEPTATLVRRAGELGFVAVGFSRPTRPPYFDRFLQWLEQGRHGDMSWLEKSVSLREDPARLLEGCTTVISLASPYPARKPATPDGFAVSRFACPTLPDYHVRLRDMCRALARTIGELYPGSAARICVDSAPIMEKPLALAAGIGFMGKNNALIIPGHGSYIHLAEILTTAPVTVPPAQILESQCGACTLCVDACPTGALEAPFCLDASRCLSYLTIEHRGEVGREWGAKMGDTFFGCDRCQEVCPFNEPGREPHIQLPSVGELLDMDEAGFRERFGRTALARAGLEKIKGNIRVLD